MGRGYEPCAHPRDTQWHSLGHREVRRPRGEQAQGTEDPGAHGQVRFHRAHTHKAHTRHTRTRTQETRYLHLPHRPPNTQGTWNTHTTRTTPRQNAHHRHRAHRIPTPRSPNAHATYTRVTHPARHTCAQHKYTPRTAPRNTHTHDTCNPTIQLMVHRALALHT